MPISEITWDPEAFGMLGPDADAALLAQSAPPGPGVMLASVNEESGYTLTAGNLSNIFGYITGVIGSLVPDTFNGETIQVMDSVVTGNPLTGGFQLAITGNPPQSFFTSLTVNGFVLLSAAASYDGLGGWTWAGEEAITSIGVYPVELV